jgi:acyl carrier protein
MEQFCAELAEIMEVDEVEADSQLESFAAWDSLGRLATIAMIDTNYGVNLNADDLAQTKTAGALFELIQARKQ